MQPMQVSKLTVHTLRSGASGLMVRVMHSGTGHTATQNSHPRPKHLPRPLRARPPRRLDEGGETRRSLAQHAFVGDRVATVDRFGLVADHGHCRGARDARTLKIPYRGAAKVVGYAGRQPNDPAVLPA